MQAMSPLTRQCCDYERRCALRTAVIMGVALVAAVAAQVEDMEETAAAPYMDEVPVCAIKTDLELAAIAEALPRFIRVKTEQARSQLKAMATSDLKQDLKKLVRKIRNSPQDVRVCFEIHPGKLPKKMFNAWADFFTELGIKVELVQTAFVLDGVALGARCTFHIVWGIKTLNHLLNRRDNEFPHMMVMNYSPFWRHDPDFRDGKFAFYGWDYLYGNSLNFIPQKRTRWNRVFANKIAPSPWMPPKSSGYALLLGQVPGDLNVLNAELKYGSLEEAYRQVVLALNNTLPEIEVVYREHPSILRGQAHCSPPEVEGVTLHPAAEYPLKKALDGAAFAISVSSTALVEAVVAGLPIVALDSLSSAWSAGCQSVELAREMQLGLACRPDRTQFFEEIAYSLWSAEEVRSGIAFNHMFHTNLTFN